MNMRSIQKWYGFGLQEAYDRGVRAYEVDNYPEAILAFGETLAACNDPAMVKLAQHYLADAHVNYGDHLVSVGHQEEAIESYQAACDLFPHYADFHFRLAKCAYAHNDYKRAIAGLQKSLLINPEFARARLYRGLISCRQESWKDGLADLRKAVQIDPSIGLVDFDLAEQLYQEGFPGKAWGIIESLDKNEAQAALDLAASADAYLRRGKPQEACDLFEQSLLIRPRYADVRRRYAEALYQAGRYDAAKAQLEQAIHINPRYADAYAQLGIVLRKLEQGAEAKEAFRRALEVEPHHLVATVELNRL
jgi:tetratricopeptide (TPR) repeat protein